MNISLICSLFESFITALSSSMQLIVPLVNLTLRSYLCLTLQMPLMSYMTGVLSLPQLLLFCSFGTKQKSHCSFPCCSISCIQRGSLTNTISTIAVDDHKYQFSVIRRISTSRNRVVSHIFNNTFYILLILFTKQTLKCMIMKTRWKTDTVFGNKADTMSLIQCDERGKLLVKSE